MVSFSTDEDETIANVITGPHEDRFECPFKGIEWETKTWGRRRIGKWNVWDGRGNNCLRRTFRLRHSSGLSLDGERHRKNREHFSVRCALVICVRCRILESC
ncbi:hypothetical protein TNCT_146951 [Trichonephila clavata]|uniref:Uncharacterized protein n=1 Tax=Trichonephila clavata TaxID=2740835 RepID=A0A8X6FA47_TRICU|nr:hypothetical protein TNCT_146951 [Trichonephila clavata]